MRLEDGAQGRTSHRRGHRQAATLREVASACARATRGVASFIGGARAS
jgi:hypothetical protein